MQNNSFTNQLESYFSIITTKVNFVNQVKKEYSKILASDFNSLDFLYFGENKVSEILCFLLNPNSSHGQGDVFLKLFIDEFNINFSYDDIKDVFAQVEKSTHYNRRIDIFIRNTKTDNIIAIENKIYNNTKDQTNQINDYLDYLNNITKNNDFTFFYLSPRDKKISNDSFDENNAKELILNNKFRLINYEIDIIPLVHKFAIFSENDRVRAFILAFEKKLKSLYMGNNNINEASVLQNFIKESHNNLDISFKIFNSINSLKAILLKELEQQFVEIGEELNIIYDSKPDRFILPKLGDNKIGVSFDENGVFWGIVRLTDDHIYRRYSQIENLFVENYQHSYWWSIYAWQFRNIENNSEFWQSIIDKSFKEKLKTFIKTIQENDFEMINTSENNDLAK